MPSNIEVKHANFDTNLILKDIKINELIIDFCSIANSYNFIDEENTTNKLSICIVANPPISNHSPSFIKNNFSIIEYNKPRHINGKQDIENKKLIKQLAILESNFSILESIKSVSILILYNKTFGEVNIDEFEEILHNSVHILESTTGTISSEDNFLSSKPKYTIDQVVLNENLRLDIEKSLTILESRYIIYEKWGVKKIEPEPKAIINFYGESGTGKTMTAHAIADRLGCNILSINYADIESKYVGDAPKNLLKAFTSAKTENALLFFDEADSFLGKRISNVTSSSDQAINSLRSQMLILLDGFEGIVIFATNLLKNYDKAFESRIFKHLKFDLPDLQNRKLIILKSIPLEVPFSDKPNPLSDTDAEELAILAEGFSGRHIKNSILDTLTHALMGQCDSVAFEDFIFCFNSTKNSILSLNKEHDQITDERKVSLGKLIATNLAKADSVSVLEDSEPLGSTSEDKDVIF